MSFVVSFHKNRLSWNIINYLSLNCFLTKYALTPCSRVWRSCICEYRLCAQHYCQIISTDPEIWDVPTALVWTDKTEQHACANVSPDSSRTRSWLLRQNAEKMIGEIEFDGVRLVNISTATFAIQCGHSGRRPLKYHPIQLCTYVLNI